jgi:hypothetical protein
MALEVTRSAGGSSRCSRRVDVRMVLLGADGDGSLVLTFTGVTELEIRSSGHAHVDGRAEH